MGCQNSAPISITYSVPVTPKQAGETEVRRHPKFLDNLVSQPRKDLTTLQDILLNSMRSFPNNNLFGTRNPETGKYEYKTYNQALEIAKEIGSGIEALKLAYRANREWRNYDLNLVGVMGKNREEWILLDYSNILYKNVMVPLYDTLGPQNLEFILHQTNLSTIFCTPAALETILKLNKLHQLKNIVCFDPLPLEKKQQLAEKRLQLYTWDEVRQKGRENRLVKYAEVLPSDIYTFSYTSGTTGIAKAVMITHGNFTATLGAVQFSDFQFFESDLHFSFLPLAHLLERAFVMIVLYAGASMCFSSGDITKFGDELKNVRPTMMPAVPRLLNKFYTAIREKFDALTGLKKSLVNSATETKLKNLHDNNAFTHALYDKLVFNKIKNEIFGGRLRCMIVGSAPISSEVLDFMKVALQIPILEVYGQTETGCSFLTYSSDPHSGHVGGPSAIGEFKLIDIPEMGYTSNDKGEGGIPMPRGEVLLRGAGNFQGYYKNDQETESTKSHDNWVYTGDVGMILPNGSLKLIDRRKNLFKLAQGEYIAPEKVENTLLRSEGVAEVFVYGEPIQTYLVGIIVPQKDYVMNFAQKNGIQGTFEELCQNPQVVKQILANLEACATHANLNGLERVKKIKLEPVSFVIKEVCTPSFKIKRNEAREVYKKDLAELYRD